MNPDMCAKSWRSECFQHSAQMHRDTTSSSAHRKIIYTYRYTKSTNTHIEVSTKVTCVEVRRLCLLSSQYNCLASHELQSAFVCFCNSWHALIEYLLSDFCICIQSCSMCDQIRVNHLAACREQETACMCLSWYARKNGIYSPQQLYFCTFTS
jgi:hypothetical protein